MRAAFTVLNEIGAPSVARREMLTRLGETLDEIEQMDVELLVSELVTNTLRRSTADGSSSIDVRVEVDSEAIVVAVDDAGQDFSAPVIPQPRLDGLPNGFGLFLIDQLSAGWGAEHGAGCCIWFRLDRRTGPASDSVA